MSFLNRPFSQKNDSAHPPLPRPQAGKQEDCRGCARLQGQIDIGSQRLSALELCEGELRRGHNAAVARLHQLSGELDNALAQIKRLEKRQAAMLAASTRQRDDLPSQAHAAHQLIARDYQTLVEQRLLALAHQVALASWHLPGHQPASLYFLSLLTQELFQARPARDAVEEALGLDLAHSSELSSSVERAVTDAEALWDRAEATGLAFRWDFEWHPNAPLDPSRQAAWGSCDPRLPPQHLIAPAYLVEQQVHCLQLMLTGSTGDDRGSGVPLPG
ncbi:hypothetical protein [Streptomyces luteolus]|uniref:Uncharacterized protein n=1 Tax=Streptomyces luteolus TaxID=3043615 RepID=A0ABT6SSJ9_9ACTN|nr:hypothetical protein [Streptomyces sp. B-S-A12]MDI3418577.1 hypothetical protein [Streptomyces sp. B-S-A12]